MSARNPIAYAAGQAIQDEMRRILEQHNVLHPFERLPIKVLQAALSRELSIRQLNRHLQALRAKQAAT